MAKIQTIKNKDDIVIYPQTHTTAVFTNEGGRLQDKLDQFLTTEDIGELEEVAAIAELQSNKVTEINEDSTDTTYPSAKAVYEAIAKNSGAGLNIIIPADGTRPAEGEASAIYLISAENAETENIYEEWMYINSNWEMIGTTAIDLTPYITTENADGKYALKSIYGDTEMTLGSRYDEYFERGERSASIGVQCAASANALAVGYYTTSLGGCSIAEGENSSATGFASHAEGKMTSAASMYQHVQGRWNIKDDQEIYAHIVGNGNDVGYSNAHTLDWSGNGWFAGDIYVGSTSGTNKDDGSKKLATEEYVNTQFNNNEAIIIPFSSENYVAGTEEYTKYSEMLRSCVNEEGNLIKDLYVQNGSNFYPCMSYDISEEKINFSCGGVSAYPSAEFFLGELTSEYLGFMPVNYLLQQELTFDDTPTAGSTNPVTSTGIKTYVDTLVGDIEAALTALTSGSGVA